MTAVSATDMANIGLVALPRTNAHPVSTFTADITKPTMLSYTVDMNTHKIAAIFSETVDVSEFQFAYGSFFPAEIYTRGCHWIPRLLA
jgi:hypothetical protein